jgi:hypothetical protein
MHEFAGSEHDTSSQRSMQRPERQKLFAVQRIVSAKLDTTQRPSEHCDDWQRASVGVHVTPLHGFTHEPWPLQRNCTVLPSGPTHAWPAGTLESAQPVGVHTRDWHCASPESALEHGVKSHSRMQLPEPSHTWFWPHEEPAALGDHSHLPS